VKITLKLNVPKWSNVLAGLGDRFDEAVSVAMNMAASMARQKATADILSAGKFGARWVSALQVTVGGSVSNMKISMSLNLPGADIFETGGQIQGDPLLWLPLSGTDAEGIQARNYGGLFSGLSSKGTPLLFSLADKLPKYFGIESVTVPKLFHLREDLLSVQANFRSVFDTAWQSTTS